MSILLVDNNVYFVHVLVDVYSHRSIIGLADSYICSLKKGTTKDLSWSFNKIYWLFNWWQLLLLLSVFPFLAIFVQHLLLLESVVMFCLVVLSTWMFLPRPVSFGFRGGSVGCFSFLFFIFQSLNQNMTAVQLLVFFFFCGKEECAGVVTINMTVNLQTSVTLGGSLIIAIIIVYRSVRVDIDGDVE